MKKALNIFILTVLMPALGYAQKAYEAVQYSGMVQNTRVKFSLANGYPVGSYAVMLNDKLHQKQTFTPTTDVSDNGILRLDANNNKAVLAYLIIEGIIDEFNTPPGMLKAQYYTGGKSYSFILKR